MDRGAWQATVWAVAKELDKTEATEHISMYETYVCLVVRSCPTLCDPMDYSLAGSFVHGDSPGMNVGFHAFLQGIFPTQGSNPGLLHVRWILYRLSHKGSLTHQLSFISKLCEDLEYMFFNCLGCYSWSIWIFLSFNTLLSPYLSSSQMWAKLLNKKIAMNVSKECQHIISIQNLSCREARPVSYHRDWELALKEWGLNLGSPVSVWSPASHPAFLNLRLLIWDKDDMSCRDPLG